MASKPTADVAMQDNDWPSTVKNGLKDGVHLGALPCMGTVDSNKSYPATVPCAKNPEELYAEFKAYALLRKKDERETNLESGSVAYVISAKWLRKYHAFIMFDQFDSGATLDKVQLDAAHFTSMHPGPMTSRDDLCEEDASGENIYGTGTMEGKQFSPEYLDTYVETKYTSRAGSFLIYNQKIFEHLFERYGGQFIQRYYIKKNMSYYSEVEVHLHQVRTQFLNAQQILNGSFTKDMFKKFWTQCSTNANLKDVKRRLLDHLRSAGLNIGMDDVRLWLHTDDTNNPDRTNLEIHSKKAAKSAASQQSQGTENGDVENNSGVDFPGESIEPLLDKALRINQMSLSKYKHIIVEYKESSQLPFAFKYEKKAVHVGMCEWCNSKNILKITCKCGNVRYCNEDCQEKDKRFHFDKCTAQADGILDAEDSGMLSSNSRQGLVGLSNLGNTCYMNSSIQCLSNTYELTKYFLDRRYKDLVDREWQNPLGTNGRLTKAWGKLLGEMWIGQDSVVRPDLYKRQLGQYNQTFEGYGQHDSQECINTILDFMSEDLYKKEKKPYVEQTEADGKSDEEASMEAWNKHILRNESIICDLFYGQYKSTVNCSQCDRESITFDPFLMVTVPISNAKLVTVDGYFMRYHINETYQNFKFSFQMKDNLKLYDMRQKLEQRYGWTSSNFIFTWVHDKQIIHMFNSNMTIKQFNSYSTGVCLIYEIPAELKPALPPITQLNKSDCNMGIDDAWVKIVMHTFKEGHAGLFNLPRIIWARKDWSLKRLHLAVFDYYKELFVRWYREIEEKGKSDRASFQPSYTSDGKKLDLTALQELFQKGDLQKQFDAFFPALTEENWNDILDKKYFSAQDLPYQLKIENVSRYMEDCHFCGKHHRSGCPLPYTSNTTVLDMLHKLGEEDNISFYNNVDRRAQTKSDFILNIFWERGFEDLFIKQLSSMTAAKCVPGATDDDDMDSDKPTSLNDCFEEFRKPEMLDDDNKWYCNKCKEHVRANKQMEIYKAPPILVVNLKRFKQSGQQSRFFGMYGGGGVSQKIDAHVDFPLEGLDLTHLVKGKAGRGGAQSPDDRLIYDCYAVSNHYGNMGFGHYTAYARSPTDDKWYEFDDSRVSQIKQSDAQRQVVGNAAYNLFFRQRDWHERNKKNGVDYEKLSVNPDMEFLNKIGK